MAALATTTVYTTNSTNNFVYLTSPSTAAAAAGYMLLSIINIIWIFYYGTTDEVRLHSFIDSYSGNKPAYSSTSGTQMQTIHSTNPFHETSNRSEMGGVAPTPSAMGYGNVTSASLGAFENSTNKDATYRESGFSTNEVPPTPTEYPYKARAVYTCKCFSFYFIFFTIIN